MNEHLRAQHGAIGRPPSTQAADGFPRRQWSAAEVMRMLETGILEPGDPFELIGGELVAMAAKGLRHEGIKNELMLYWSDRRPKHIKFAIEAPLRLGPFDEPEPDITLFPATLGVNDVRGDSVLLVVEVADTSWPKDSGLKAAIYARFGVRDYWIVNTVDGTTRVHRRPTGEGYAEIRDQPFSDPLVPEFVPELAVRLADLVATDDR